MFIYFLIEIDFLKTRSAQSYFPLANQNTHLTTHEPIKIRVIKVKIKLKAGERREHDLKAISDLNPRKSWRKVPKAGGKLEEMFKMYDSVRKELQDEEFIFKLKTSVTVLDRS